MERIASSPLVQIPGDYDLNHGDASSFTKRRLLPLPPPNRPTRNRTGTPRSPQRTWEENGEAKPHQCFYPKVHARWPPRTGDHPYLQGPGGDRRPHPQTHQAYLDRTTWRFGNPGTTRWHSCFVACPRDHYVAVVDLRQFTMVAMIDAGREPDGFAWWAR